MIFLRILSTVVVFQCFEVRFLHIKIIFSLIMKIVRGCSPNIISQLVHQSVSVNICMCAGSLVLMCISKELCLHLCLWVYSVYASV